MAKLQTTDLFKELADKRDFTRSRGRTNCPNCGAPIDGNKCEHCRTLFFDFGAIEIGKPAYFKFVLNGMVYIFRGIADVAMTLGAGPGVTLYADDAPIQTVRSCIPSINADLHIQSLYTPEDKFYMYQIKENVDD